MNCTSCMNQLRYELTFHVMICPKGIQEETRVRVSTLMFARQTIHFSRAKHN